MARQVPQNEKLEAIRLIKEGKMSQRDIALATGLSRPYLRKMCRGMGHQFPRNGIEVRGDVVICACCGMYLRRPPSKVTRASVHYCSNTCKNMYARGEKHANWKGGVSSNTFSKWLKNQSSYDEWRKQVLERDNYTCQITGIKASEEELDCHHIQPKADYQHLALDVSNGITVCQKAHDRIHALVREGKGYEEAVELAKKELTNG